MNTQDPKFGPLADTWNDVLVLDELGLTKPDSFPAHLFVRRHQKELDAIKALARRGGYPGAYSYLHAVRTESADPPDWESLGLRSR